MDKKGKNKHYIVYKILVLFIVFIFAIVLGNVNTNNTDNLNKITENNNFQSTIAENTTLEKIIPYDLSTIPKYSSKAYVEINNNIPYFDEEDYTQEPFEKYSDWIEKGKSGVAYANICKEIMPSGARESTGNTKELSGWVQKEYDIIDGKYLYNRCHLIGWQLAGETDNKYNLITGTKYLNVEGMLPFENEVAEYMDKNENNHVLYRVTPIFEENNKLASGVLMEAWSVEDNGKLHFNVYCYNVQPGIVIDYATGDSYLE